jgi:hypothetical protein
MSTDVHAPAPTSRSHQEPPSLAAAGGRLLRVVLGLALITGGVVWGSFLRTRVASEVTERSDTFDAVSEVVVDMRANGSLEVRTPRRR